ncbi:tetratricopeptide repeat protein [Pyxidicoccus xibeiensis]|uniref:tetratricopeptide repeat protein n=1 Tax=Pyxidicoccus xibeiensis TaxID=2906759 RepID=UPI0020A72239|nr:tetratricopeptide repeat protein [Pyxidicoccus xibeiensis]MCP3137282.1 tetratricopeptide repeat protein [Pyxidicoccus xibeiensis]
MCGVCAGRPGKTNLGDVIAPDRLFFHDTGKRTPKGVQQDLTTYNLRYDWKEDLKRFDFVTRFKNEAWWKERPVPYEWQENWALLKLHEGVTAPWTHPEFEQFCPQWEKVIDGLIESGSLQAPGTKLTDKGRERVESVLFRNKGRLPDLSPKGQLLPFRVHFDPMGSGSQVIEDVTYWNTVTEHMRKTLGLELEAAAIGALAQAQVHLKLDAIVMKGVMDFANHGRDDHFKEYAARASAECLMAFLREHIDAETVPGVDDLLTTGSAGEPPAKAAPSALLNARHEVVPFHGRERLLTELEQWCDEGPAVSVQMLHAEGGAGKTRLAIEWTARRRQMRWAAGFLAKGASENESQDWLDRLWSLGQPLLVVVDYAESQPKLHKMLLRLYQYSQQPDAPRSRRIRLLLLARNDGDWWKSLRKEDSALAVWLDSMPARKLPSLSDSLTDRMQVFHEAAKRFAEKLKKPHMQRPVEEVLGDEHFQRVLYVHMAALAAVEGLAFEPNTLMDVILDHEERFWEVNAGQARSQLAVQRALARQIVAAATLRGGFPSKEEAKSVVGSLLGHTASKEDDAILQLLNWVYELNARGPALFLPPLEPDLLGEGMVLRVASANPSSGDCVPSDWIDRVFPPVNQRQTVGNGLRVLGRVSAVQPVVIRPWIERLLAGELLDERAALALEAAKSVGQHTAFSVMGDILADRLESAGTVERARQLDAVGIPFPTVSLDRVAEWTTRMLLQAHPALESNAASAVRASLLDNWGIRLGALGRHDAALKATQEAVKLYRQLESQAPNSFQLDLARCLINLGPRLSVLGRRDDALKAAEEAAQLCRDLAACNPNEFQFHLAGSLNNLGPLLSDMGQREEALKAGEESMTIYRSLASRNPDAFQPDLAMSLINLGNKLSDLGRRAEALKATEEAVQLNRGLTSRNPDAFQPDLAMSLSDLGIRLSNLGRREEALKAAEEAVTLYRGLAARNPDAFQPNLARSLNNLGNKLSELGRRAEALKATEEAVQLNRSLAACNPDAFQPNLALSLNNLGNMLSDLGWREEALKAAEEAVTLYRGLAARNPDAFLPNFALSLNNLGCRLSDLGWQKEALKAAEAAVQLRRDLVERNPDAFQPDLAMSLYNLGSRLSEVGRGQEALKAVNEAVTLYRGLAERNPDAFQPDLAMSLDNLGSRLSDLGQSQEALKAAEEAVTLYRSLVARNPDAFQPDLAGSLDNLGSTLGDLGQWEEALEAAEEAVTLYRSLASRNSDKFQPDLAYSLNNLGSRLSDLDRHESALLSVSEAIDRLWPFFLRFPSSFEGNAGVILGHLEHLHTALDRPLPSEVRERIEALKRLESS